ncbi:MAG: amidohydrolase, partial [Thermoanaerobaculia bacterium]|nr:amidohydrolase [Thermoanaerobaculia bacterium]
GGARDAAAPVIAEGAVAIVGAERAAVGPAEEIAERYPGGRVVDAGGGWILPGLINAHTHAPMTLFRGLADDLPLMTWLEEVIFPAEAEWVDEEFVRWGTRLACWEMIRGGVTTFVDMYYYEDAIAEEAEACGLRAVLGETLIDFPAPDHPTWEEAVAYTRSFLARWRDHPRVTPAVAPHSVYTVSEPHLRQAAALAAEYDAPLLIHLAEDAAEVERTVAATGRRPVEWADALGILGPGVIAAHMVWPDPGEIELLARRGVGVVHCPQSNMKVAAGAAPVAALLAAGVPVGLGTDGAASNNDLDLWQEIDTAAKLAKLVLRDPTALDARRALSLATSEGARAIGLGERIGSLEPGKRADLIVVERGAPHLTPEFDPYSALVYSARADDVSTVLVDGRVLMERRRLTELDPAPIVAAVERIRRRLSGAGPGSG